ncbi:phage major capsid protein [soil metagenome]
MIRPVDEAHLLDAGIPFRRQCPEDTAMSELQFKAAIAAAEKIIENSQAAGRAMSVGERREVKQLLDQAEDAKDAMKITEKIERMRYGPATKSAAPTMFARADLDEFAKSVAAGEPVRMKATLGSGDAGLVDDFRPGTLGVLREGFRVRRLFTESSTESPAVWFRRIDTGASQAGTVAEGALKPEATIVASQVEARVRKIAVYLPVAEEVLDDGGDSFVRAIVNDLGRDLIHAENNQLLNGNGVAPNIEGVLATTGIGTRARGTDSNLDSLIKATGMLRNAYMPPTDVVIHPSNFESIRLAKSTSGEYLLGSPLTPGQPTLMGAALHVTTDVPLGTGLVMNAPELATVYGRSPVEVEYGTVGDQFQRNIKSMRVEERIAFAVTRPSAAVSVTGLN